MTISVDIVLPCLDEAPALDWVLSRIPHNCRPIVVDNGSVDESADLARRLGATVITCERRGYGAACHAGLQAATADIVAVSDCDGSLHPGDVLGMVQQLAGGADLVVARRRAVSRRAFPLRARVANAELARRVRSRTALPIRDIGPLRVAYRSKLLELGITDRRSGYPVETIVRAADAGWHIVQADVDYLPRIGKSKVTGTWQGTWQSVHDMNAVLAA